MIDFNFIIFFFFLILQVSDMNHYPDNYHGYGRDASNMQGMGYGGYRDSAAMVGKNY